MHDPTTKCSESYVFYDVAVIRCDSGRRYDPDLSKKENDFLEPFGYFARANAARERPPNGKLLFGRFVSFYSLMR